MKTIIHKMAFWLSLLTGLGLIIIGTRFFLVPLAAEHDFGIAVDTGGNFSFHYIKGARDIFSGLAVVVLLLMRQYRALGMLLLCAVIVPATDMSIVLARYGGWTGAAWPHLSAILIALLAGINFVKAKAVGS